MSLGYLRHRWEVLAKYSRRQSSLPFAAHNHFSSSPPRPLPFATTSLAAPRLVTMLGLCRNSALRHVPSRVSRFSRASTIPHSGSFARLLSSLAVLEQREGKLSPSSLAAVTAAQKLGGSVVGFVAGGNGKTVAEEVGKVKGVEKVVYVDNAAYDRVS